MGERTARISLRFASCYPSTGERLCRRENVEVRVEKGIFIAAIIVGVGGCSVYSARDMFPGNYGGSKVCLTPLESVPRGSVPRMPLVPVLDTSSGGVPRVSQRCIRIELGRPSNVST